MHSSNPPPPLLVTTREAARMLAVSERTLWTLTNDSTISCVRIGRSVRYAVDDLRDWIDRKREGGNAR